MRPRTYSPERGDIVWIDFSPQAGHEQAKASGFSHIARRIQQEGRPRDLVSHQ